MTTETTKKSFIEKMIEGLKTREVHGGRTFYVGSNYLAIEIKDGKLFNRGDLQPGWFVKVQDTRARVHSVDISRATVVFGNNEVATHENSIGISTTSEIEILDPEATASSVQHDEVKKDKPVSNDPHNKKYKFMGAEYGKSPLARAIVAKYCQENPKASLKELEEAFPASIMGRLGVFQELEEAKKLSGSGQPRYFFKDEQLVKLGKQTIAVCNQFTTEKIDVLIEKATKMGYVIEF